jgi:DNA-binding protein H-NS
MWSGRGLKPRWLTIAMSEGKQLDDFLIDAPKKN